MGLCHEVVEESELPRRVEELTSSILSGAPESLAITKQQIATYAGTPDDPGSFLISQLGAGMMASAAARETDDAREGLAAFLEKRQPVWYTGSK